MEWMEQTLHRMLDHLRVSPDREFFRIEVGQAVRVFSDWAFPLGLIPVPGVDYDLEPDGIAALHPERVPKPAQDLDWKYAPSRRYMIERDKRGKGLA